MQNRGYEYASATVFKPNSSAALSPLDRGNEVVLYYTTDVARGPWPPHRLIVLEQWDRDLVDGTKEVSASKITKRNFNHETGP
jgi:hypothetical protein